MQSSRRCAAAYVKERHVRPHVDVSTRFGLYAECVLTLINLEEGLRELASEQGFWQISEVLLQHVCDVIRRLALVVDSSPVCAARLVHLTKSLDARFNS